MTPVVRVVGLGPGDVEQLSERTQRLVRSAPTVRLRTRVHPAAEAFSQVASYDDFYERAASFESLYAAIVEDLVALAVASPNGEVVYAVPGSPVVAERTVQLLLSRDDVRTICEPAVSVIDVACANDLREGGESRARRGPEAQFDRRDLDHRADPLPIGHCG